MSGGWASRWQLWGGIPGCRVTSTDTPWSGKVAFRNQFGYIEVILLFLPTLP